MSLLRLERVSAGYGSSLVVRDVTVEIAPGEVVCLLGPNGAGKSTVLKAVFKQADIQDGRIAFKGEDITKHATHELLERGIAYVPQGRINFPTMTVRENMEMGGFLLHERSIVNERVAFLVERFPMLKTLLDRRAGSLSGGEGQMLAIARALMMNPSLLLLDEPSLGLSPISVEEIFGQLRAFVGEGMAILIVEQNIHIALDVASRGYLLAAGSVVFAGSSAELGDPERMRSLYLAV